MKRSDQLHMVVLTNAVATEQQEGCRVPAGPARAKERQSDAWIALVARAMADEKGLARQLEHCRQQRDAWQIHAVNAAEAGDAGMASDALSRRDESARQASVLESQWQQARRKSVALRLRWERWKAGQFGGWPQRWALAESPNYDFQCRRICVSHRTAERLGNSVPVLP